MNMPMQSSSSRLRAFFAVAAIVFAAGCHDVQYDYNIPEDASDCPTGMDYRSSGSGIVDRSSGAGIVDRNDDAVNAYCYIDNCSGTWDDSVSATVDWHQDDHDTVVANRRCIASVAPQPDPQPSNLPVAPGDTDTATDTD
jgi:hypothetical protein